MNTRLANIHGMKGFTIKTWFFTIVLIVVSLLEQAHCFGQGTVYNSSSDFDNALAARTTITFETLTPSPASSIGTSPITVAGATFSNASSRLFITSPTTGIYPISGTGQYLWNYDSGTPVGISLPAGMTGFGADFSGGFNTQAPFDASLTATLASGQMYTYDFTGTQGSWTFFGVIFSEPIVSLVYSDGGQNFPSNPPHEEMLDNVIFGTAVPEPQVSLFAFLSLIVLFIMRGQKNRKLDC